MTLTKSSASNHWNELIPGLDSIELTFGAVTAICYQAEHRILPRLRLCSARHSKNMEILRL